MDQVNNLSPILRDWLTQNKAKLPLRFTTAKVNVIKIEESSTLKSSQNFYKPISKILNALIQNAE